MTSLFSKLAEVESKLAMVESDKLGVPQRKNLLIRKSTFDKSTKVTNTQDILVSPKPYITTVKPRYINLSVAIEGVNTITISLQDIQAEIPRVYPIETFDRAKAVINPLIINGIPQLNNVNWYSIVFVDDRDPVVWTLILTKDKDKKNN